MKGITVKSLWTRLIGTQKGQLEKEEREYLKAKHEEEFALKSIEALKENLLKETQEFTKIKVQKEYLDSLRIDMNNLLSTTSGILIDEKLEKEVVKLTGTLNEIIKVKHNFDKCVEHLKICKDYLESTSAVLKDADYNLDYLYTPWTYPDLVEQSYVYSEIGKASKYLRIAHEHCKLAQSLGPRELPNIVEAHIYTKKYVLYDSFFDDYYTEASIDENIKVKRREVKESISTIENALRYMVRILQVVNNDHQRVLNELNQKRPSLLEKRKKVIHEYVTNKVLVTPSKDQAVLYKEIFGEKEYKPQIQMDENKEEKK